MKMPQHYNKWDEKWLKEQLQPLPLGLRSRACEGYSALYNKTLEANPGVASENTAGRTANIRLREWLEQTRKTRGGEVYSPPIVG